MKTVKLSLLINPLDDRVAPLTSEVAAPMLHRHRQRENCHDPGPPADAHPERSLPLCLHVRLLVTRPPEFQGEVAESPAQFHHVGFHTDACVQVVLGTATESDRCGARRLDLSRRSPWAQKSARDRTTEITCAIPRGITVCACTMVAGTRHHIAQTGYAHTNDLECAAPKIPNLGQECVQIQNRKK